MNYVLQVVRGRSTTTTLKLADGVTSVGRHDDCLIRIKSSQVSRRHCEFYEDKGRLMIRDLGSSNGTFVNGKRVLGQQILKVGDELTVGTVTLRVATLTRAAAGAPAEPVPAPARKPGDTAVVDAIPLDDEAEDAEFEIALDDDDIEPDATDLDIIPLADDPEPPPPPRVTTKKPAAVNAASSKKSAAEKDLPALEPKPEEDDAVAQFLLDLKLDEDD
jgi:pSer/pThr/pTyr-binding forkhead associated (FHA) protein